MDTAKNERNLSRDELQVEAQVIARLIDTATLIHCSADRSQFLELLEMAQTRAEFLHSALDIVNAPKVAS